MREQPRACAVLGLGPFARRIIERLPPGALGGPAIPLDLRPARSRAGHDWLPHSLRGPAAPALAGTRAGGRLDVLAGGKATLRTLEPTFASFATRCRGAGVPGTLVLLVGLFDVAAGGLLDLIAILRASEALEGLTIVVLGVLSPSPDQEEPLASARAALALEELDSALAGGAWELPQPGGVLSSPQVGAPQDATVLLWPAGPRWSTDEAQEAAIDALLALPWLPELPGGGFGALRAMPILAPAAELRDRLAERYVAVAVERWLAPGAAAVSLEDAEARVFANPPSEASDWLEGVRARTQELLTSAEQVAAADPDAAADHVRVAVPALDRQVNSEIGAGGPMRRAAEDAARRWVAGARVQAEALTDELCSAGDGGGFALVELAQRAPERLVELRSERERQVGVVAPGSAREALDAATEALREAIDKPAGLSVRLLGRGGPRLMQPLRAWAMAFEAWAEAHWRQAAARVEVGALGSLAGEVLPAANRLQEYEVELREAVGALRSSGRGANERPTRGVLVLPTGAAGLDEAAERLEHLGGAAIQGWLRRTDLGEDPSPVLLALRDRLRTRLGPAEARLTLGGALASLPADGPARAALDHAIIQAGAPLLGAAAHEESVAVLPPDVAPEDLRLPEGAQVVRAPRREDGLLVRLAGGFDAAALGLRKAALDEGLSRLVGREPKHPDLLWRRFPTA